MAGKVIRLVVENESLPERRKDDVVRPDGLSREESQVLRLVAAGVPRSEIASRLAVKEPAVKEHIKRMLHQIRDRSKHRRKAIEPVE